MRLISITTKAALDEALSVKEEILRIVQAPDRTCVATLPSGLDISARRFSDLRVKLSKEHHFGIPHKKELRWMKTVHGLTAYLVPAKKKTVRPRLSSNEKKALSVLHNNPRIPARTFAILYYGDSDNKGLLCSKTQNKRKAYYGKQAWLLAASYLSRLIKKGYVSKTTAGSPVRYSITDKGRLELLSEDAA